MEELMFMEIIQIIMNLFISSSLTVSDEWLVHTQPGQCQIGILVKGIARLQSIGYREWNQLF
jgi:hypothetical protein